MGVVARREQYTRFRVPMGISVGKIKLMRESGCQKKRVVFLTVWIARLFPSGSGNVPQGTRVSDLKKYITPPGTWDISR